MSYPYPEEWLNACREAYDIETTEELEKAPWMKAVKEEIRKQIQEAAKLLTETGNLAGEPDGPGFYLGFWNRKKRRQRTWKRRRLSQNTSAFRYLEI